MTHLRLIAPTPVALALLPGSAQRDPRAYAEFWTSAHEAWEQSASVPAGFAVSVDHASTINANGRYSSLEEDSLDRTLQLLTVNISPQALDAVAKPAVLGDVDEATMRVYEHGVAVLELSVAVLRGEDDAGETWLDAVQDAGNTYARAVARHAIEACVDPLTDALRERDRRRVVVAPGDTPEPPQPDPMWVSRALLVAPEDRALLAHWTKDTAAGAAAPQRQELLDGTLDCLVLWLNYAFVDVDGEGAKALGEQGRFADDWRALRYAQVTYASLDLVDSRLGAVLARSATADTRWELEDLRESLIALSRRAEVLILQRQELEKYMAREVRVRFDALLATWEHHGLVEDPVKYKIDMCQQRLDDLAAKRAARSGLVTDLILLGIGITSIASMALAITDFGRGAASDPAATGYDLGASGFTSWFAAQPIDVVLLISSAASVILVVLYVYFRRQDRA